MVKCHCLKSIFEWTLIQIIMVFRSTRYGHLIVYQWISTFMHSLSTICLFFKSHLTLIVMSKSSASSTSKVTDCGQTMDESWNSLPVNYLMSILTAHNKYDNLYQSPLKGIVISLQSMTLHFKDLVTSWHRIYCFFIFFIYLLGTYLLWSSE